MIKDSCSRPLIPGHRTRFTYQVHPSLDWARPNIHNRVYCMCFCNNCELVRTGFKNDASVPILSCPGMDI